MDWTFWAGLIGIAAFWGATQWFFSQRRHSEQTRARDAEAADAMIDVDRGRAQSDVWRGL